MFNSKKFTMLVILAVVLTAGAASAGDMNWSFYGKVHSSINMMSNGENSQLGLTSNTSRYGFKGWAPINDEWKFVWQIEQAVNVAQGDLSTNLRNTFVGFKNAKLGEVRMGRHDTPHKTLGRKTTFFFDTVGDNRSMTFGTDTREDDILAWVSPNWDGFSLFLAYQFDQDGTKLSPTAPADAEFHAETVFSGMAAYATDDFFVGASTIMFSEAYGDMDVDGNFGDAPMVFRFAGKYMAEKFALAASYLSVGGQYYDDFTDPANPVFVDQTASTIGFEGLFHANEDYDIKAGYYMADPNGDVDDDDFSLLTVGIDRNFSKALQVYVQYAAMSYGDMAANWSLNSTNGFATGKSYSGWYNADSTSFENPYGFSFGVNYKW